MKESANNLNIKSNGIEVCYNDAGSSVIPIIFIHGFPFDKSTWNPQIDYLKNTNRVISYDNRGFGKSEKGGDDLSINLFADDLINLMDSLKIKKAIVCGLSMGGYILLNAINRYKDRFHAIILCDTQCIADTEEGKAKRFNTIKLIEDGGIKEFTEGFLKNIFCSESLENKPALVEKIKTLILSVKPESITAALKALANRVETCSMLSKVKVPAMIICGKEDKVTPAPQSEFMHDKIIGSELHIIESAGHMSNLEQPEIFNNHLENFIKKIS